MSELAGSKAWKLCNDGIMVSPAFAIDWILCFGSGGHRVGRTDSYGVGRRYFCRELGICCAGLKRS